MPLVKRSALTHRPFTDVVWRERLVSVMLGKARNFVGARLIVHPAHRPGLTHAAEEGSLDIPSHVVFEVLPWLRPESVHDAYKATRRILNVNLRNRGDRKFDVVKFVLERGKSCDPDTLDLRHLHESWNAEFPEKKFKDTNSFSTNFKRGLRAVKQSYYL